MTYQQTLTYLYESQLAFHLVGAKAYKPGLDNTRLLMQHLGNPHEQLRCVHIAGTNGKGSTSHLIAAALQAFGLKVALYTSPHLVDFRERIRINGEMIPEQEVIRFVEQHHEVLERIRPSFFETTMAMAFSYFASQAVDIAVIEVGLGGRLDSTNIISPCLSVITNIGFDHTEFLGHTLAAIAGEKAGIIKPGVPVVIGESAVETDSVFRAKATECSADIVFADRCDANPILRCQLQGIYQEHNRQTAYVALRTLGVKEEAIREGFAHVCTLTGLRGRWETLSQLPLTICDTGHNSHGLQYVAHQLQQLYSTRVAEYGSTVRLHIVMGVVDDKDVELMLSLMPREGLYYFTQAHTHRAISAERMLALGLERGLQGTSYATVEEAIHAAQSAATARDIIFIGGSNYVVGEALRLTY